MKENMVAEGRSLESTEYLLTVKETVQLALPHILYAVTEKVKFVNTSSIFPLTIPFPDIYIIHLVMMIQG